MRSLARTTSFIVALSSVPAQVGAQETEPLLRPMPGHPLREVWLQSPPSPLRNASAEVNIVGLHLGDPEGPADIGNLRIITARDAGQSPRELCLRITSRDGRYSARGRFGYNPTGAQTARLAIRSAYDTQLKSYSGRDLAVLAQAASDCDRNRDGAFFAAATGGRLGSELIVRLDGPVKRVQVQLGQGRNPVSDISPCKPNEAAVQVGFVQECRIALPPSLAAGLYQLAIGETASNGKVEIRRVQVRLGPA